MVGVGFEVGLELEVEVEVAGILLHRDQGWLDEVLK